MAKGIALELETLQKQFLWIGNCSPTSYYKVVIVSQPKEKAMPWYWWDLSKIRLLWVNGYGDSPVNKLKLSLSSLQFLIGMSILRSNLRDLEID